MRIIADFYASLSPAGLITVEIIQLLVWLPVACYLWRDYGGQELLYSKDPVMATWGRLSLVPVILPAVKMLMLILMTMEVMT